MGSWIWTKIYGSRTCFHTPGSLKDFQKVQNRNIHSLSKNQNKNAKFIRRTIQDILWWCFKFPTGIVKMVLAYTYILISFRFKTKEFWHSLVQIKTLSLTYAIVHILEAVEILLNSTCPHFMRCPSRTSDMHTQSYQLFSVPCFLRYFWLAIHFQTIQLYS